MKLIYLILGILFLNVAQSQIAENIIVEVSLNYSTTYNLSTFNSVATFGYTNEFVEAQNEWNLNYNLGIGISLSNQSQLKFLIGKNNFRESLSGYLDFYNEIRNYSNRIETSKLNSYSIVYSNLKPIRKLKAEFNFGLEYNIVKNKGDDFFHFLGLKEKFISSRISIGIFEEFRNKIIGGVRIYCSNYLFGKGSFEMYPFEIFGEIKPLTSGIEVFFKYRLR